MDESHPCWMSVASSTRNVRRCTKMRLLTGTYYLQKDRAKFKRVVITDLCLLFGSAVSEDRVHFLAECFALSSVRHRYLTEIEKELMNRNPMPTINSVLNDKFALTQLILNCTSSDISSMGSLSPQGCCVAEQISRRLCFALHLKRCELLGQPE